MWFGDAGFDQNFWPGFWGNLFSDLIAGILVVAALNWLWRKVDRAKIQISVEIESAAKWAESSLTGLSFVLWNSGRLAFAAQEIYFHIFIDPDIQVNTKTMARSANVFAEEVVPGTPSELEPRIFTHLQGDLMTPIFPGSDQVLLLIASVPLRREIYTLYYYCSSAYGPLPRRPFLQRRLRQLRGFLYLPNDSHAYTGSIEPDLSDLDESKAVGPIEFLPPAS
jgi:hypothetical protein